MAVFVTGGRGPTGSAVVKELIDAGRKVLGLAPSDAAAESLAAAGADVHRGSLENLGSLRSRAVRVDDMIQRGLLAPAAPFA